MAPIIHIKKATIRCVRDNPKTLSSDENHPDDFLKTSPAGKKNVETCFLIEEVAHLQIHQ